MADDRSPQVPAPDFSTYTAASCQVRATAWVLQLIVGDVVPNGKDNLEVLRLGVGFPWPLAKLIHQVMGAAIKEYEQQEGEITVPKRIQSALDENLAQRTTKSKE